MDIRDLIRLVEDGCFTKSVRLLVADPPCVSWSRSGLRLGTNDERDMLEETCRLIALMRPQWYLIGNVPGLDDGPNLHVVQRLIGGLSKHGYCTADFARLNASSYGVPQHRIRPFWVGHLDGPCIQWPEPTHGDPDELHTLTLPNVRSLLPWVTCGDALGHLSGDDLGRPVRLRKRSSDDVECGVSPEPEFTLQDRRGGLGGLNTLGKPSATIVRNTHGNGSILVNRPATEDRPAPTLGAKQRGQSAQVMVTDKHPALVDDQPSTTIRGGGKGHSAPSLVLVTETSKHHSSDEDSSSRVVRSSDGGGGKRAMRLRDVGRTGQGNRRGKPTEPSATVTAKASRVGAGAAHVLDWPWDRPSTTVQGDDRLAPPGHHDDDFAVRSLPNAVVLSEKAATILQGFPETWCFVGKTK
jgi:site-specific DNA-cytosine methylase